MGYFGAGNFGDDALLADWLRRHSAWLEANSVVCDVLSRSPRPLATFAKEAELGHFIGRAISRQDVWQINCGDYTALVAPGGSLLQDKTTLRSLLFYLTIIRRFERVKKPVYLLHQGIGPLGPIGAWMTRRVLRRVQYISLRDEPSYQWCLDRLQGPKLDLAADPILTAQFVLPEFTRVKPQLPYALLIPKATGALPNKSDLTTEPTAIASTLGILSRNTDYRILVAALHPDQDEQFCNEIVRSVPQAGLAVPQPPTANHFWGLIYQASFVISYRLHGLIAAAACNVPAFGVAYDPKVSSFCDEIGFPWCHPAEIHSADTQKKFMAYSTRIEAESQSLPTRKRALIHRLEAANTHFSELLAAAV
jgi:polysaccharide pyruvyl transferase CsaB